MSVTLGSHGKFFLLNRKHCGVIIFFTGIQIATVHGGVRDCGDVEYPGIFIRLDDPSIWHFINDSMSQIETNDEEEEKPPPIPTSGLGTLQQHASTGMST